MPSYFQSSDPWMAAAAQQTAGFQDSMHMMLQQRLQQQQHAEFLQNLAQRKAEFDAEKDWREKNYGLNARRVAAEEGDFALKKSESDEARELRKGIEALARDVYLSQRKFSVPGTVDPNGQVPTMPVLVDPKVSLPVGLPEQTYSPLQGLEVNPLQTMRQYGGISNWPVQPTNEQIGMTADDLLRAKLLGIASGSPATAGQIFMQPEKERYAMEMRAMIQDAMDRRNQAQIDSRERISEDRGSEYRRKDFGRLIEEASKLGPMQRQGMIDVINKLYPDLGENQVSVPPPAKRTVGMRVTTDKGTFAWDGEEWQPVSK